MYTLYLYYINSWTLNNTALSYAVSLIYVNFFFNKYVLHACMLSHVWLFATLWTVACQAPTSMGFPRQEYWSELPFPPSGDLVEPEPASGVSCIGRQSLYHWATWEWCHMCASVHGILHVRILEWSYSLLHGIFPTQGLNSGLLNCKKILYHLSHQVSPIIVLHNSRLIESKNARPWIEDSKCSYMWLLTVQGSIYQILVLYKIQIYILQCLYIYIYIYIYREIIKETVYCMPYWLHKFTFISACTRIPFIPHPHWNLLLLFLIKAILADLRYLSF